MIPSAPKSSARLAVANSPTGMRTIAAAPLWRTCAMPDTIEAVSHSPCCPSSVTAGKPSRPTSSATIAEERPHQPLWTVSPARSRRAREKAVAVVMGKSSFGKSSFAACVRAVPPSRGLRWPFTAGRHRIAVAACRHRLVGRATGAWRRISAPRFDLLDRFRHQFVHGAANLVIRFLDALGVEVVAELAEDVIVADLLEISHDHRLGIGVGLGAGEPELLRRPQAEVLVATGVRLESQFLVEDELLLEALLALVERSHACLAVSGAAGPLSHRFPLVFTACRVNFDGSTCSVGSTRGLA